MTIPPNFGPKLLNNFYPLGEWRINLLASYKTGSFATYNPNSIPGIVDNVQWKDRHYIDARISRGLTIGKVTLRLYADISNLFNMKLLSYAGFSDNFDYRYFPIMCMAWHFRFKKLIGFSLCRLWIGFFYLDASKLFFNNTKRT